MAKRKPKSVNNYESDSRNFTKKRRQHRVREGMPADPTYCDSCGLEECDIPDCGGISGYCAFCMAHEDCP